MFSVRQELEGMSEHRQTSADLLLGQLSVGNSKQHCTSIVTVHCVYSPKKLAVQNVVNGKIYGI